MSKVTADITMSLDGRRMFDHLGDETIELERTAVIESPYATHLYFTVRR